MLKIDENTNYFPRGSYAHIVGTVTNSGEKPAYNVKYQWSAECLLDNLTNDSIERLPLPLHPDSTGPSTGGILYPKQNESVFCTVECSYVGTWIVTLTVTVNGSYADSQPVELVVYPRVDE